MNSNIYDDTDITELADSIKQNGLLSPLVITKNGTIISGHRRYDALKSLGMKEVEVIIAKPNNDVIELIEHNRHRTKTNGDIPEYVSVSQKRNNKSFKLNL